MLRGRLAWAPEMVPKELPVAVVLGAGKTGWLSALNASNRSCRYAFSVKLMRFSSDGSNWLMPSIRREEIMVGKVRMWYWNASVDFVSNALVLKAVLPGSAIRLFRTMGSPK